MIEPITGKPGVPRARAICDDCGKEETATCDYEHKAGGRWEPNEGQMHRKLTGMGWEIVKRKLYCPQCKAKRKKEPRIEMEQKPASITPLREPTREQKRQIMSLLEVSYDTGAGRYKGADTDATVASAIGGGVMPGWVADLRDEFFGPDGGNGEMEALCAEMSQWLDYRRKERDEAKERIEAAVKALATIEAKIGEAEAMQRRVEAIRKAVGPKAGAA